MKRPLLLQELAHVLIILSDNAAKEAMDRLNQEFFIEEKDGKGRDEDDDGSGSAVPAYA